ncbi:MAG: hypothetical protein GY824_05530, partial [Delftia sp.]|nr:hypothetical protein [Delftia sp.]
VLPVAAQPLVIEAVAESGALKPGVENVVYVLTSYPDGRPARARLQISVDGGQALELDSGEFGLTEFSFTPQPDSSPSLHISAQDETGLAASRQVAFATEQGSDAVLLRADRAAYVVGETMTLLALTPVEFGDVYLDIVKNGQTLSTRSERVQDGQAQFAVDASHDMLGTLELHAYKVLPDGSIVRDTRVVVVDAPNDLAVSASTDKDVYLPGETATINFQTDGAEGGVQSALGVAIVDESVYALQRQDPGFAKLYFMLEQELMEPFYQVQGFELPASIPANQVQARAAQDDAAKATWAGFSISQPSVQTIQLDKKINAAREKQGKEYKRLGDTSLMGMILIPLLLWLIVLSALNQAQVLDQTVKRLVAISFALPLLDGYLISALGTDFHWGRWGMLVLGPAALIFAAYAWIKSDQAAQFLVLLTLAWCAAFFLLDKAAAQGDEPDLGLILMGILSSVLIPGAYLALGQGLWVQARRFVGAIVTALGALMPLLMLVAVGVLAACSSADDIKDEPLAAPAEPALETKSELAPSADGSPAGAEAPRLRQYFPETLYWAPEVLTDEGGFVSLEIPMADSITTWRLTALASSQDGRLGTVTRGVRVFQDFFVDVDLPVALTQGDEISIPVGVFNYLPQAQEVRLEVQAEAWFELLGQNEQTLTIASNDIEVVYFPIRVLNPLASSGQGFGRRGFQVTAWGSHMSDAVRREVSVVPN